MSKKTEYEQLKKTWYAKLKEEGFKDIEYQGSDLISRGYSRSETFKDPELRQLVQDYYCMSYYFLNEYQFETEQDRIVWTYHTEGLSIRNIVKLINSTNTDKTNRVRVWKTIKRFDELMKDMYLRYESI